MKISLKGFITHKEAEKYSDCADNYSYCTTNHRFAISDGVTKSFFPTIWSRILVDKFVALQGATDLSIEECQLEWLQQVSKIVATIPEENFWVHNAFHLRKSGYATLITLRFDKKMWYAKALGDSFLFFVPKGKTNFKDWIYLSSRYISTKPEPIVFDSYPDYYSSREEKSGIEKEINGKLEAGKFYLMTDALSEWLINEKENAIKEIETWTNQDVFEQRITELRNKGLLNNDDSSILIIDVENDGKHELTYKSVSEQKIDNLIKYETEKIEIEEDMNTNNEEISMATNKKIDRLIFVNIVLIIIFLINIFGLIYVISENNKNLKQIPAKQETVDMQGQKDYTPKSKDLIPEKKIQEIDSLKSE